jgi:HSP20 family protein
MAKTESVPVKHEQAPAPAATWPSLQSLRGQIDRLFDDFSIWTSPFGRRAVDIGTLWRPELTWGEAPAVDFSETGDAFEITAELPGLDEKNIEVSIANGCVAIKGEKAEEKEEKKKNYYLHERHFGSFERRFRIPEGVDPEKIEASFKKGVLTVTLPKRKEAKTPEKKVEVKAAA